MASLPAEAFDLYGSDTGEFSPASHPQPFSRSGRRRIHLSSQLMALVGLALFACAMMVAFRVISLDAAQQLQQPAIDFALCGAVAFLGLSISWVHLGNKPAAELTNAFAEVQTADLASTATSEALSPSPAADGASHLPSSPAPALSSSPIATHKHFRGIWPAIHVCPFCRQKMAQLAAALYQCRLCRHLENHAPLSFLDSATGCSCAHCQNPPLAR